MLSYSKVMEEYPAPVDEAVLDELLKAEINKSRIKFVVLDDDPTGVQTVHDINVYTDWSADTFRQGFAESGNVFFVLTNSRGMTAEETAGIHHEIVANALKASSESGIEFMFISRSDSTLRGHYPLETEILSSDLEKASGLEIDGEVLCPFFKEGGRFTIGDVHYVKQGDALVPAAETEFAKDKTFGYSHSSIPEYIEEKTNGRYKAETVTGIPLTLLRARDVDAVEHLLLSVTGFNKVVVNAVDYCDVKVFSIALYRAMAKGKRFMFRTAAGFVATAAGVIPIPLLKRKELLRKESAYGGLIVVGSHTAKTTAQLNQLLAADGVVPVGFRSSLVLEGEDAFRKEVERCVAAEEDILRAGKTAVVYTERALLSLPDDTKEDALCRSVKISEGVQQLVGLVKVPPAFVIAKGGITSSDIGVKALCVRRANVLGQIYPGIPVWELGKESRFPGMPYVIFPGNVGDEGTLRECYETLSKKE